MTNRKSLLSILIVVFVVLVLPLLLLASRQRQEIRKKAAANDVTVYLNQTTLDPGGTTTGAINVSAGGTRIQAVRASFTFDSTKLTISNLRCGTDLPTALGAASIGVGTASITCAVNGIGAGITNKIFAAALFNVQVASSASRGSVIPINLTSNTRITDPDANLLSGALNNASITVAGGAVGGAPVSLFFNSSSLSPGGSTNGSVKVTAGSTPVQSVGVVFTFDSSKVTVSNLHCGTDLPSNVITPSITNGTATISCTITGVGTGISNRTFDVAVFNVQVSGSAVNGSVIPFTLTSNTIVTDPDGNFITGNLTSANITVGTAVSPTPTSTPGVNSISAASNQAALGADGYYQVNVTTVGGPALTADGNGNVVKYIGAGPGVAVTKANFGTACASTWPAFSAICKATVGTETVKFNLGGSREVCAIFHNNPAASDGWSEPVCTTGSITMAPVTLNNTITPDATTAPNLTVGFTPATNVMPNLDSKGYVAKYIGIPGDYNTSLVTKASFGSVDVTCAATTWPATSPVCKTTIASETFQFNAGSTGSKKICAIFHNNTAAADGWSNPVCNTTAIQLSTATPTVTSIPTPTAIPSVMNSVSWVTSTAFFKADDFYIVANGQKYYANVSGVDVRSDSGNSTYTTLEVTWNENGQEMRLYLYFRADGQKWWSNEARTYGASNEGKWIYYTRQADIKTPLGQPFTYNGDYKLYSDTSDQNGTNTGYIYAKNPRIQAFLNGQTPPPSGQVASISISPSSGTYSVGSNFDVSVLLDTFGNNTSGADIVLQYPAELLEIQNPTDVSYGFNPLYSSNTSSRDNVNGKLISISTMSTAANTFSGQGTLLTVRFKVKAPGTAGLKFQCSSGARNDTNIWSNGEDIVSCDMTTGATYGLVTSGGPVAGDVNGNGCVGAADLGFVYGHYQTSAQCTPSSAPGPIGPADNGDFNRDGCVDDLDLSVVSSRFSYSCNE